MRLENFLSWRTASLRQENGVLVGSDLTQEWLLPWWWQQYQKHNSYPVAFVDFGMSFDKKQWCKERGELIPLRIFSDFVKEKEEVDPALTQLLEEEFGKHFWDCRSVWFKKPLALLQTPFEKTLWIDLDCEVRGSLKRLFEYANEPPGLGLVEDPCDSLAKPNYLIYNSGVISYRRNINLIIDWARNCIERNALFRGDQEVLSAMIAQEQIPISKIDALFNWSRVQQENKDAVILHWHGVYGKHIIRAYMNAEELSF